MLHHIGIDVSDLKRSKAFYQEALAPLGYRLIKDVPQPHLTSETFWLRYG